MANLSRLEALSKSSRRFHRSCGVFCVCTTMGGGSALLAEAVAAIKAVGMGNLVVVSFDARLAMVI